MRTVLRSTPTRLPSDPEALIKEARRRQRIRYLVSAAALLAACGLGSGLYATLPGNPKPQPPRPSPRTPHPSPAASRGPTAPRLPPIAAKVLTWPPFAVDDLRTGHYFQTGKVDLGVGDYQPLMITVGRWLVYVGHGATAVHSDLTGRSRVLGKTPFFAPSAEPGAVWLQYFRGGLLGNGPTRVRQVRVAAGTAGPAITLPAGTLLVAGTRAGLLLQNRAGRLRLWLGGHAMRALPGNPYWENGFAITPAKIAYGTHCRDAFIPVKAAFEPNTGYQTCSMLRVFDVRSGQVRSFRSPAGTTGWVPPEFDLENPMTPAGSMMAAEAVVPSHDHNRGRLYVLRLAADHGPPLPVPASGGYLFSKAAWSPDGSWLLYQGAHFTLWGYHVRTRAVRSSSAPCCLYTIMAVVRAR